VDPLPGGKAIGIPDPTATAQASWVAKDKPPAPPGVPTVNIRPPEQPPIQPVPPPTHNPDLPPVPVTQSAPPPDSDLAAALKARGVVYQQQSNVPGGVRFRCGVAPNPQDPTVLVVYEAVAADYRSAVIAVLNQIDKSR